MVPSMAKLTRSIRRTLAGGVLARIKTKMACELGSPLAVCRSGVQPERVLTLPVRGVAAGATW